MRMSVNPAGSLHWLLVLFNDRMIMKTIKYDMLCIFSNNYLHDSTLTYNFIHY